MAAMAKSPAKVAMFSGRSAAITSLVRLRTSSIWLSRSIFRPSLAGFGVHYRAKRLWVQSPKYYLPEKVRQTTKG